MPIVKVRCPELINKLPLAPGLPSGISYGNLRASGNDANCCKCGGVHTLSRARNVSSEETKGKKKLNRKERKKKERQSGGRH